MSALDRTEPDLARPALEGHLRDILDSLPDGVFTVDPEWRISSVNRSGQALLGIGEAEALGRLCRKVMRSDRCQNECPLRITLETGRQVWNYEVKAESADGRPLDLAVNTAVLRDAEGRPQGGVVSFRDVTADRRLRDDLLGQVDRQGLIGRSRAMKELYELIDELADCCSTVLIEGESGTGKELVARAIQRGSRRKDRPFIKINCGAFAESLLESELFGHVRGAFTDARADRAGRFELADGGTLFLDEIGVASPSVQVKLLRVLQEQEFERVGGNHTLRVDVRVLAATNRPLRELVREGTFREDLFYRLNVVPVTLPPLRDRREDLIPLAEHFLRRNRAVFNRPVTGFSPRAMGRILEYGWPGNVRELENAVEHAFVRCHGSTIQEAHLPRQMRETFHEQEAPHRGQLHREPPRSPAAQSVASEHDLLATLVAVRWNRQEAARRLGIGRTTLWRRMVREGLTRPTTA
ncbi:MAG: sigma 54-interacting transcriptional regulator [Candidatus Eisenbacteria bacterium]|nr:sigma 54-interacting transcriptional regulator [Candidatus Eisenbacteria bacterium]MCC7141883.1 sigma 54-interacting transcriptional regulator [Candidatus Eisenbacteria bacterium]